ncbi:hypothetical protein PHYSODRAFT_310601 [Phytophthora sojae]|uniref:Uncharacterized protein n=1 Tax=Phytophthora sojae (strain P6497) TaxID=1094619 RepID=G4YSE5_PHYSP|nr:hypothetical protein PHYSODRAFT_310601 [Phytophthora sojae]EGZ22961.1 hypothetical protein PHYSODRAFT_310601 [Phytophthora sojae]|eukprot:XP_009518249.1 hypothetical protein PHYSODRAFT_310601 [Phytophthora sojae]
MNLSRVLCSPERQDESAVAPVREGPGQKPPESETADEPQLFTFVPDNERKRSYRMSAKQRQRRTEYEAYTSRVENLTLDINELRQQIRCLLERRDLYFTRLLLQGQHYEVQVIELSWKFLASLRSETHGLAIIKSVRVLVDINTAGGDAARIQQVRSTGGVCVVEVLANFIGRIIRESIMAMFPHILSDEALIERLIGRTITFSPRLLLYFDARQRIVRQIVQADILSAIAALAM